MEYYNGIVFQGYIEGLPRAVLSGGRYDKLLRRFNKNQPALGFAVYFDALRDTLAKPADFDIDTLLIYENESAAEVARAVDSLIEQGISVRAERQPIPGLRAKRTCKLKDLKEKGEC